MLPRLAALQGIGPAIAGAPNKEWMLLVEYINSVGNESGPSGGNNVDWAVDTLRKATGLPLA